MDRSDQRREVEEQIEFSHLCHLFGREDVEGVVELMTDVLCGTRPTLRIGGEDISTSQVKERFLTLDSTACEKQVLCSSESGRLAGQKRYYLLCVYQAASASEGAVRDEKVLSTLWESSLRDPSNIVHYAPLHVEYHGEDPKNEKKYIIAYDFGPFKPAPLHGRLIRTFSAQQKLVLMRDIATGVKALYTAGLYHRNLQPGSVFVFSKPDSEEIQVKLVGFEYTTIDGDSATVFANVAKRQEEDPSAFFSRTMKAGLSNKKIGSQLDWAKEDVYSMGALFYFIWTGKKPRQTYREKTSSKSAGASWRN